MIIKIWKLKVLHMRISVSVKTDDRDGMGVGGFIHYFMGEKTRIQTYYTIWGRR